MIHHVIEGQGDAPPLVLLHAIGTDLGLWAPQVAALARRFRVIRCDARGHGSSPSPPGPYSVADLAGDVLELAHALALERFHVCGLSMGGAVALWLALHAPDRIGRLVVANSAARFGTGELWDARIAAVDRGGMAAIADGAMERFFPRRSAPARRRSSRASARSSWRRRPPATSPPAPRCATSTRPGTSARCARRR